MPQDEVDIIAQVRKAESAASAEVRRVEDERRRALSQAEEQAAAAVSDAKTAMLKELVDSRARAKAEAEAVATEAAAETARLADGLSQVPDERMGRAVLEVVKTLKKRWQSTE